MQERFWRSTLPVCLVIVAVGGWLATAGTLTPPNGPVAPTMKTLDEISTQISQIPAGSVKRVIRGVITYTAGQEELSQSFSPAIDPTKSVVTLSPACATDYLATNSAMAARTAACVTDLTSTQITVRVDTVVRIVGLKVGYQIVEYN
jgi:hypothetical protein